MTLQDDLNFFMSEWEKDSVIDEFHIESECLKTPNLHSKYLQMLRQWKAKKLAFEVKYNEKKQLKFRYWRGELSKEELVDLNLPQWQMNKPLKSELESMAAGDKDLNSIKTQMDYIQIAIECLEHIIKQIQNRDWEIRNYIAVRRFNNGDE